MLTLTGNGRLTRNVELRSTRNGDNLTTVSVASDRRDRLADPVYVGLILWRAQGEAAAEHVVKGQAVAFSGRFEPREFTTRDGREGVAYELHDVALEYCAKPRGDEPAPAAPAEAPVGAADVEHPLLSSQRYDPRRGRGHGATQFAWSTLIIDLLESRGERG